jgi:hypothetical protein
MQSRAPKRWLGPRTPDGFSIERVDCSLLGWPAWSNRASRRPQVRLRNEHGHHRSKIPRRRCAPDGLWPAPPVSVFRTLMTCASVGALAINSNGAFCSAVAVVRHRLDTPIVAIRASVLDRRSPGRHHRFLRDDPRPPHVLPEAISVRGDRSTARRFAAFTFTTIRAGIPQPRWTLPSD